MRRIGNEVLLAAKQPSHALRHLIERGRQRALLGAALDRCLGVQLSCCNSLGDLVESPDRPSYLLGDQGPGNEREGENHGAKDCQAEDRVVDRGRYGVHTLCDAHGSGGSPAAGDRDCSGEDRSPQGLAIARLLVVLSSQGGGYLRSTHVAGSDTGDSSAVGGDAARSVEDEHPSANALGRRFGYSVESVPFARAEWSRRGGRDDVGLASRLVSHLRIDAVTETQAQRDAKRDHGQEQDVGDGE
jgi:hypothetical protein